MKIVKNAKLIKRNGRIGQWTSLGALGVLAAGMYLSFQRPDLFAYSIGALLLGFTMTQIGMYFSNRYGRSPRPDEQLDAALKGLPGDTTLYHYVAPAPHLAVGPMGIWVLLPYHQRGRLTYQKNRWRLSGGGLVQGYMTIFGQEGLGRPEVEAASQVQAVTKFLRSRLGDTELPPIDAALVFSNDKLEIDAENTPLPALPLKKLKDFFRQRAKDRTLSNLKLATIRDALPQEASA
jgi:hypothetical protein